MTTKKTTKKPAKKNSKNRVHQITVRVNSSELALIKKMMRKRKEKHMSTFIRTVVLERGDE